MAPKLRYEGPLTTAQVSGFGHFLPGEEKTVDFMTAAAFSDPRCAAEGWVVIPDEAPKAEDATVQQTTTGTPPTAERRTRRGE